MNLMELAIAEAPLRGILERVRHPNLEMNPPRNFPVYELHGDVPFWQLIELLPPNVWSSFSDVSPGVIFRLASGSHVILSNHGVEESLSLCVSGIGGAKYLRTGPEYCYSFEREKPNAEDDDEDEDDDEEDELSSYIAFFVPADYLLQQDARTGLRLELDNILRFATSVPAPPVAGTLYSRTLELHGITPNAASEDVFFSPKALTQCFSQDIWNDGTSSLSLHSLQLTTEQFHALSNTQYKEVVFKRSSPGHIFISVPKSFLRNTRAATLVIYGKGAKVEKTPEVIGFRLGLFSLRLIDRILTTAQELEDWLTPWLSICHTVELLGVSMSRQCFKYLWSSLLPRFLHCVILKFMNECTVNDEYVNIAHKLLKQISDSWTWSTMDRETSDEDCSGLIARRRHCLSLCNATIDLLRQESKSLYGLEPVAETRHSVVLEAIHRTKNGLSASYQVIRNTVHHRVQPRSLANCLHDYDVSLVEFRAIAIDLIAICDELSTSVRDHRLDAITLGRTRCEEKERMEQQISQLRTSMNETDAATRRVQGSQQEQISKQERHAKEMKRRVDLLLQSSNSSDHISRLDGLITQQESSLDLQKAEQARLLGELSADLWALKRQVREQQTACHALDEAVHAQLQVHSDQISHLEGFIIEQQSSLDLQNMEQARVFGELSVDVDVLKRQICEQTARHASDEAVHAQLQLQGDQIVRLDVVIGQQQEDFCRYKSEHAGIIGKLGEIDFFKSQLRQQEERHLLAMKEMKEDYKRDIRAVCLSEAELHELEQRAARTRALDHWTTTLQASVAMRVMTFAWQWSRG